MGMRAQAQPGGGAPGVSRAAHFSAFSRRTMPRRRQDLGDHAARPRLPMAACQKTEPGTRVEDRATTCLRRASVQPGSLFSWCLEQALSCGTLSVSHSTINICTQPGLGSPGSRPDSEAWLQWNASATAPGTAPQCVGASQLPLWRYCQLCFVEISLSGQVQLLAGADLALTYVPSRDRLVQRILIGPTTMPSAPRLFSCGHQAGGLHACIGII